MQTDGNGLKVFEKNKFKTYDLIDTIQVHTVYSIAEDLEGNIWFSTPSDGIFEFDGEEFRNYGLTAGISDLSINGIASDANGDIVILENDAIDVLERQTSQVRRYRGNPCLMIYHQILMHIAATALEISGLQPQKVF